MKIIFSRHKEYLFNLQLVIGKLVPTFNPCVFKRAPYSPHKGPFSEVTHSHCQQGTAKRIGVCI